MDWPTVPRAAGGDEASAWLKEGMTREGLPRLLFLIGGPGAGKSHAASHVLSGLEALEAESGLAQRTYKYALGSRGLTIVNDATIGSDEFPTSPLSKEIDAAISEGDNLLACVNRGVV